MGEIAPINRRPWTGSGLVVAAATFNMALCFVNTHVLAINETHVIAAEVTIIGLAVALSYRLVTLQGSVFAAVLLAYFCMIWLVTGAVNPKIVRDFLIPLVFTLYGAWANPGDADRLVYVLILVVFAVPMFEWFWVDQFLRLFDALGYFLAKGGASASEAWSGTNLAVKGIRPENQGRTLLPVLGLHRVSSIFLAPTSIGTFAAIAFAWLLVRLRFAPLKNLIFMAVIAALIVMGDSRFAAAACLILVIVRLLPLLPRTLLWLLPFVFVAGLIGAAAIFSFRASNLNFQGRLVWSGGLIAGLDVGEWFGIGQRWDEATLLNLDSGYAHAIYAVGLPALVLLWTVFSFARDYTVDGARYRMLLALYLSLAFCVSEGVFSIKTAALAWFLLGASQNRDGVVRVARSVSRLQVSPASS